MIAASISGFDPERDIAPALKHRTWPDLEDSMLAA
jgi:hypothetical protein